VTIQLPLYNERFVAGRLIAAAAAMDWPKDCLEIQILDDSTDDTRRIVDREAGRWRRRGLSLQVLRRDRRDGFKAGALAHGMDQSTGEFLAIFDADFIPGKDFLRRSMAPFQDPGVGMVQARWGFLNPERSWLTGIEALLIGPHFAIEHRVRSERGLFFNFNGTAGIWRRSAIETAGGWRADTVTEDLDLSYRAQMIGWRFVYLDDLEVPSEVPVTLSAFRIQQQRWAKGSIQTARKILPALLRSGQPIAVKIEACAHLLANLGWLFGAMSTLLLYPVIVGGTGIGPAQLLRFEIPLMGMGVGAILFYFMVYAVLRSDYRALAWLPLVPIFSIGIAPAIAVAVVTGGFTRGGRFERTPKFGGIGRSAIPLKAALYHQGSWCYAGVDLALAFYSLLPVYLACQQETWLSVPFLLMLPAGFFLAAAGELGIAPSVRRGPAPKKEMS
jgi:cellulose synthase/poly-beta-1,6-N-acetylglucosamine synthase-like glycosyltransferase